MRIRPLKTAVGAIAVTGLLYLMAGCQTLSAFEEEEDGNGFPDPANQVIELSEEERAFSRALAHFSTAQILELNQRHEEAVAQYRLALEHDPDYLDTYLRIALNLIRRNKTDEAIEVLTQLVERRPQDAQALVWLGSAYRHKREMDNAISAYRRALERAPDNAAVYIQLVDLLIQRGDELEAIELLKDGLEKADETLNLYRVLGEMYMRQAGLSTEVDEARRYMELAIATFNEALEIEPKDATMLQTLADLYLRDRQYAKAIDAYEELTRIYPDDIAVKERLAYAYELVDDLEGAVRVLQQMATLQPTNARIFFALGDLYERLEEYDNAIVNYQLASRLNRSDAAPYLKLAFLQMEDAPEEAIAALREGLEYLPDNPRMLEMLGYVLFNKRDYADAIVAFREAEREWRLLGEEAMTPNFHLYKALSYYFNDQPEEVPDILWMAVEGNPDTLEAFAHFVFQDEDEERMNEAVSIFTSMHEREPENTAVLTMLAYVHSFKKDYEDALRVFDRIYELARDSDDQDMILNQRFYFWYAAANEREGNHARAEELFYQCLELDPENAEAYNYLAYMWAEKGINLEKAKEYVLIALEARPDSGAFIDTLGWIYYQQGRYEEAYDEIRRALDILPDDPTVLDHLGDIYHKLDEPEKALAKWKRSFIIDPENEDVSRKLADRGIDLEPLRAQAEEGEADDAAKEEADVEPYDDEPDAPEQEPEQDEETKHFLLEQGATEYHDAR